MMPVMFQQNGMTYLSTILAIHSSMLVLLLFATRFSTIGVTVFCSHIGMDGYTMLLMIRQL